jgi:hypothetical protein
MRPAPVADGGPAAQRVFIGGAAMASKNSGATVELADGNQASVGVRGHRLCARPRIRKVEHLTRSGFDATRLLRSAAAAEPLRDAKHEPRSLAEPG